MTCTIAIQPDRIHHRNGEEQSFSDRWIELARQRGVTTRIVDARSADFFSTVQDCNGFMWRFGYDPLSLQFAKRILPAVQQGLRIPTFPSHSTVWTFEDKIAQHYVMCAAGIPTPRTWIFWNRQEAMDFCRDASYPLVLKLATGAKSSNVRLLRSYRDALWWLHMIFGSGVDSLEYPRQLLPRLLRDRWRSVELFMGNAVPRGNQHGYFYVQEFIDGNDFDTRITIIGRRAYAFRRENRPGDFRASGSGLVDWSPDTIDPRDLRLAFRISFDLEMQSVAIDCIKRDSKTLLLEFSYTYATWALRDCPGHWVLAGSPETGTLEWQEGRLDPEDAIFNDFLQQLEASES